MESLFGIQTMSRLLRSNLFKKKCILTLEGAEKWASWTDLMAGWAKRCQFRLALNQALIVMTALSSALQFPMCQRGDSEDRGEAQATRALTVVSEPKILLSRNSDEISKQVSPAAPSQWISNRFDDAMSVRLGWSVSTSSSSRLVVVFGNSFPVVVFQHRHKVKSIWQ